MKRLNYITLLLLFLFSIINGYGQSADSTSYPVVYNNDSLSSNPVLVMPDRLAPGLLKENIWIPDEDGGAMPLDIIHIETPTQHKIYVYGKRRILVFDGDTYNQIATIDISEYSQYFNILVWNSEIYSSENHFAYNEADHLLYCVTENLELIAIDTETDLITDEISERPWWDLQTENYYSATYLRYDERTDRIYWIIAQGGWGSNLYVFDAGNYSSLHTKEFEYIEIRDIEINETLDEYYLSLEKEFRVYNADNFQLTNTISNDNNIAGDLLYINDNGIHKLFCFTYQGNSDSNVQVIDFNDGSSETSFPQPNSNETACYYNPNTNTVYVGLATTNDLWVFDPDDYSTIANIDTHISDRGEFIGALTMTSLAGKVIIGKDYEIVAVDETDHSVELIKKGFLNSFFRIIAANGKAFTIGAQTGTVDVTINDMTIDETLQIGAQVYYGCYNPIEHKAYYYNNIRMDNANVYILNTLTNEIKIVEIGSSISDVIFNEADNQVLISTIDGSTHIKLIDGVTDELLDSYIALGYQFYDCISMFLAPNNKLYCMVRDGSGAIDPGTLVVYDAANDYSFLAKHNYNVEKVSGEFCYNPTNGNVYATARDIIHIQNGVLTEVNGETNTFSHYSVDESPYHIVCNPIENKIFISYLHVYNKHLTVFDCGTSTLSQINLEGATSVVYDLAYDYFNQFVYALHNITGLGRVSIIQEDVVVSTLRVPEYSISLKYNTGNYNLYVYVPYNAAEDNEGEIWEFQIFVNENGGIESISNKVPLVNKHASKLGTGLMNHDMLIYPVYSRLYVANAAFSNISVIDMPEALVLRGEGHKGFTWLSIPRHLMSNADGETTPTSVVFDQNNISGSLISLELRNNNIDETYPPGYEGGMEYANWDPTNDWSYIGDEIDNIHSTKGYILIHAPD
ncbi:MAG: hypothetical protein L3J31_03725, partial [Bacteroidales bacterium]|nr:hypothetical protein [Bacteroidales bacterium]